MTTQRLIGAHVSAAGGHDKAIERAVAIGCNCAQVFSGSPRVWQRPSLDTIDTKKLSAKQQELHVKPIFTHALYLINLTADKPEILTKSVDTLKKELMFDAHIGGAGVVVHLGSHLGNGWAQVSQSLVESLTVVLNETPANSTLLIENSAGQQGKLCSDLSEIRWLLDELEKVGQFLSQGRLGWCVDTCHAWAAGYYLGSQLPKTTDGKNTLLGSASLTISELKLWQWLKVVHVNDSRDPFASGRDRHANIGEGTIPHGDLEHFLNLPELQKIPMITEVPGFAGNGPDAENIKRIKKICSKIDQSMKK